MRRGDPLNPTPHNQLLNPHYQQDEVSSLRNAAAGTLTEAEERLRTALAEYEALQR